MCNEIIDGAVSVFMSLFVRTDVKIPFDFSLFKKAFKNNNLYFLGFYKVKIGILGLSF